MIGREGRVANAIRTVAKAAATVEGVPRHGRNRRGLNLRSTSSPCSPSGSTGSRGSGTSATRSSAAPSSGSSTTATRRRSAAARSTTRPTAAAPGWCCASTSSTPRCAPPTATARRRPASILLAPSGRQFDDQLAAELAAEPHLALLCGRYEGVDERVREHLADDAVSIGPYVLSGGELAAMVVADAVLRKLPGALGHADSAVEESFSEALDGAPEYPHYTRPPSYRGLGRARGAALGRPRAGARVAAGAEPQRARAQAPLRPPNASRRRSHRRLRSAAARCPLRVCPAPSRYEHDHRQHRAAPAAQGAAL